MLGFRSYRNTVQVFLLLVSLMAGSAFAQNYSVMGITALVAAADGALKRGDYDSAIPALIEVIDRTIELDTAQGRQTLQGSRFQLARAYFQVDESAKGMTILEEYLAEEPRRQNEERLALRMMAQGYLEKEEWEKVTEFTGQLLAIPNLDKDHLLNANLLHGQALFRQEKWAECIKPLAYVMKNSKDKNIQQLTQTMSARALVESEQWGKLFRLVRSIYRTDSKYDITLNITLMHAGKTLFDEALEKESEEGQDDLLNALFLYRMVLPREELIGHANKRMAKVQAELDKKTKIGIKPADAAELQKEIDTIKESVTGLNDLPPYEDEVTFRIGQIYAEVKRYWEGYVLFDSLYAKDRNSNIGEASVLQSVLVLRDIQETALAEERILLYLDEKPKGQYVCTLLSMMMRDNLTRENYGAVTKLRPYVDQATPAPDIDDPLVKPNLHYMLAFGFFLKGEYARAVEQFGIIIDKYPESPSRKDSIYFRGMAYMMQADYQNAMTDFLLYQEQGENEEHYAAAMFREGVCLFGMEKIAETEAALTEFIDAHPDNALVSEAYSIRGDIEAAKDGNDNPDTDVNEYDEHTLDRALADYRKAIEKHSLPSQAAYAAFQAAKVYKLEYKWQEIIDLMNEYMNILGEKADVAQAVFWIGQSQIEMKQVNDAVSAYLDAIERFGNEAKQEGVDKIVVGLVETADRYLSEEDKQSLTKKITDKLSAIEEGSDVLKLRLRVAKARLEGEEAAAALGKELISSKQELSATTPISLALMCDAAVLAGDTGQMGALYDYFLANFEESDDLWQAYRARTFQLLAEEAYASVLLTIGEAQDLFGVEQFMGWAQMTKADTLYKMGDYGESEKAYNTILGVPIWKGSLHAEAYYGMARCRLATKDYKTAHSYYQRTYMLYKWYDAGKWAADGYLGAADCLVRLGRNADAVNTLNEMLNDTYVNTLPQADTARELKKKYGGA
jgi:TolA-binding protein